MSSLATDDVVCSSSGDIATRPLTILYIITSLHLVLLTANDIVVTLLVVHYKPGLIVFVRFLISGL
jgi:hypothetical protein